VAILQLSVLALAVLGVFVRPFRSPLWLIPVAAALFLVAVGGIEADAAIDALRPLRNPLAFLVLAVPLSIMLDRLGFFSSLAALLDGGRHARLGLWVLAALVTTFLNLGASVVLLTPLYIRIARQRGMNATMLALQPALLACLASSALPISNLTNLIAAEQLHAGTADFLVRMGPASLVATAVGWFAYRRLDHGSPDEQQVHETVDRRALLLGTPVAVFVVLGFTMGEYVGVPAWFVALVADIVLLVMAREVKLGDVPFGAAALAAGLAVVASAAATPLGIHHVVHGDDLVAQLRAAGAGLIAADAINNLPALLTFLPSLRSHGELLWPVLFAVNIGPIFVLHGSLAGLLWRDTAAGLGVHVTPWQYTVVGLKVGGPATVAGFATLLVTSAAL
jgi:arsenical pump membrane protein